MKTTTNRLCIYLKYIKSCQGNFLWWTRNEEGVGRGRKMTKKTTLFLWILFIFVIPISYFLLKKVILPNTENVENIMLFAPYLFYILTFMYRIDERFYFKVKSFTQRFFGGDTSWSFSTRYQKIIANDQILKKILDELIKIGCTTIKSEKDFISLFWQSRNVLNFRVEKTNYDEYSLHFYTSIIDVSFRSMRKKIKDFSNVFEKIENNINMIDRSDKTYTIEIIYPDSSPYYRFWLRTMHKEKIIKFNCIIHDNGSRINVDKNRISYSTFSLQELFLNIERYLNLKGD